MAISSLSPSATTRESPRQQRQRLSAVLAELYRRHWQVSDEGYMREHGQPRAIDNQVRTFQWYAPYLPSGGRFLDWACRHGPDSCLLRAALGEQVELCGSDFEPPGAYAAFHDFCDLRYTQLDHLVALPYENESFHAVIGSGALEHVAMDYESLKEIHRVLKPGGRFIITYLPNWLSVAEWRNRVILRRNAHQRLYGVRQLKQLLLHTGFAPLEIRYHTFFWERKLDGLGLSALHGLCKTLFPIQKISSTLCAVAQKCLVM